jgi:uncharacterized protein (TIGR00251 family)
MADGCYKILLNAPPVDGLANAELVKWLSKQFGVPRERVSILSGVSNRSKTVRVETPLVVPEWLNE